MAFLVSGFQWNFQTTTCCLLCTVGHKKKLSSQIVFFFSFLHVDIVLSIHNECDFNREKNVQKKINEVNVRYDLHTIKKIPQLMGISKTGIDSMFYGWNRIYWYR